MPRPENKSLRWECSKCDNDGDEPCVLTINCDPDDVGEEPKFCHFDKDDAEWEKIDV